MKDHKSYNIINKELDTIKWKWKETFYSES